MKRKILIIDKSTSYAMLLEKLLTERGFGVRIILSTGNLASVNEIFSYNAVFMDIKEYIIGGVPLVKGIKILQPGIRIIFTSEDNLHGEHLFKKAIDNGVYGCIRKPYNKDEVLAVVEGIAKTDRPKNVL